MKRYENLSPRKLANKIYCFSENNEVWTIKNDIYGEVWVYLLRRAIKDKKDKRRYFKYSFADDASYITLWRYK